MRATIIRRQLHQLTESDIRAKLYRSSNRDFIAGLIDKIGGEALYNLIKDFPSEYINQIMFGNYISNENATYLYKKLDKETRYNLLWNISRERLSRAVTISLNSNDYVAVMCRDYLNFILAYYSYLGNTSYSCCSEECTADFHIENSDYVVILAGNPNNYYSYLLTKNPKVGVRFYIDFPNPRRNAGNISILVHTTSGENVYIYGSADNPIDLYDASNKWIEVQEDLDVIAGYLYIIINVGSATITFKLNKIVLAGDIE